MKSVNQISVQSCDNLKLSVISHAMKVCSVTNKSNMAKKLISQLHKFNTPINQNIYVNMLLNESYYFNNADLPINNFQHFFVRFNTDLTDLLSNEKYYIFYFLILDCIRFEEKSIWFLQFQYCFGLCAICVYTISW